MALIAVVILVAVFFVLFRGDGKLKIKGLGLEASAEQKQATQPATVPSGVKTGRIESGNDVTVHSSATGGVETGDIKAKGNVSATNTPGQPPPKR